MQCAQLSDKATYTHIPSTASVLCTNPMLLDRQCRMSHEWSVIIRVGMEERMMEGSDGAGAEVRFALTREFTGVGTINTSLTLLP